MRIATWNCCMGLHGKWPEMLSLRADVVVLPECASPASPAMKPLYASARSAFWFGDIPSKGLAVLSFNDATLEPVHPMAASPRYVVPLRVGGREPFHLLAVWTQAPLEGRVGYVEYSHAALTTYDAFVRAAPTVMAGDFNSNTIWDANRVDNHSRLVERLAELGLFSAYHAHRDEPHGGETRGTYFHWRRRDRPFHLDYIFLPHAWRVRLRRVTVGSPAKWLAHSDHCPMTVEVDG